ncbi:MAG TPA: ANTAR domain-containing protein [Solirubrobacteraceae bacterium]
MTVVRDGGRIVVGSGPAPVRVAVASERRERLVEILTGLGYPVVGLEWGDQAIDEARRPDVALLSVDPRDIFDHILRAAACPVIALVRDEDAAGAGEVSRRGVFADVRETTGVELAGAIDTALQGFAVYHRLHGAFGHRAWIEQATGVLMATHGIDASEALGMLRAHSGNDRDRLVAVAWGLVDSHLLLSPSDPR